MDIMERITTAATILAGEKAPLSYVKDGRKETEDAERKAEADRKRKKLEDKYN